MKQKIALLCIDLQKEYFDKERPLFVANGPKILKNVVLLLKTAREENIPIIHIQHISSNPSDATFNAASLFIEFTPKVIPQNNEHVVIKSLPGAFSRTNLDAILKSLKITDVIICGLTSFLCCDTTSREAHANGYSVYFIKDATAAINIFNIPAKEIHKIVCTIQEWYFAKVLNTKQILKIIYTHPSD